MNRFQRGIQNPARRRHLQTLAKVVAAAGLMPLAARGAASSQRLRTIPVSGERIPAVGLGTARTFDVGTDVPAPVSLGEVLQRFVELGGKMVDTSPMYGAAERVVGELAQQTGVGDQLFYATKVWTRGREEGIEQMRRSLRLLRTDRIDLMQVHNLVDTQTQLRTIREWIDSATVRYVGITHYSNGAFDDLEHVISGENIHFVQFPYSIANRAAEARLLATAADRGVAVITHRNFEQGELFRRVKGRALPPWAAEFDCASWGNFFLKYLLADPRVTNVIPATRRTKHLVDNMRAGLGRLPDAKMRVRMVRLVEDL